MENITDETKYYVALSQSPKIGARTFFKLKEVFGSMEKVWRESKLSKRGLPTGIFEAILDLRKRIDPDEEMAKLAKHQVGVITIEDKNYPILLKEIPDPPAILYYKGEIKKEEISLAVVGSRKYSHYGRQVTEKFVMPLASSGVSIISGLALGIDSIAHKAALEAEGRTLGVLACGLDQIYPYSNQRLAGEIIAKGGAIISEFPLFMPALRYNFPIRNRIIAGLSQATLVIEAGEISGTMLTAAAALDYNRQVLAVPGEIFSQTSLGTNRLIQMGAKLISNENDIFEELNLKSAKNQQKAKEILPESKEEEKILSILSNKPISIDKIIQKIKFDISVVSPTLTLMEMKGMVRNVGGGHYIRN